MNNYIHNHPYRLKDFIQFNPKEKLPKGAIARKITMEQLSPNNRYVESNIFEEFKGGSKFRNGDTIMARITPCLENGKTAYITSLNENELAFGSTEFIVFREIEGKSNSKYIYYLLKTPQIRDIAIKSMVGSSGRQRVQQNVLENYEVLLPTLDKQIEIANILSSLDDKIELNRRINENLEQQAQALFKSWFVDFEPFKDGKFVDSELGMIPEGWKVIELQSMVTIKRGGSPRPIQEYLSETGLPWLKISDATCNSSPFILEIKEHIKESGLNKTVLLNKGELVLSNSATPGIPKFLGVDSCIHDGWLYFPVSSLSKEFLYLLFKEKRNELLSQGNGSVFLNLKTEIVKSLKIAICSKNIFDRFDGIIMPIFNKIYELSLEIDRLTKLRDTLLPKLMTGDIKINL